MDIFGNRGKKQTTKTDSEDDDDSDHDERQMAGPNDDGVSPDEDSDGEHFDTHRDKDKHKRSEPLKHEEKWHQPSALNSTAPHPMMVTHVNQTQDILRSQYMSAVNAENQTSAEWLQTHSVDHLQLTLNHLVDKGTLGKPEGDLSTGKVGQHMQFDAYDVNEFEYKLNMAIEMYTKRIKWLLQGSKRMFGHIKGERVVICLDVSDSNCGLGRLSVFQESLMHVIDEQLSRKSGLYLVKFGTNVNPLWSVVRDVHCRIIDEAKEWTMSLQPSGGCNLLGALKHVMRLRDIDTVCVMLGSIPDQSSEVLCDYVEQINVGRNIPLHTIAFDCSNHVTNMTLRTLAEKSGGRYHCYTATCEEQIYTGTDISLLLKEIQTSQDVINKIKEMRHGMMGTALCSIMNEITNEVSKLPQSRFMPRPPGHDLPLKIEVPKFTPHSSKDWILKHGLKAKHLDLYQVLAPNAYSYREDFVPVIRKAVQSQVHEKAMVQFAWHDGSVKNVHVDMTRLFAYQKQLGTSVSLFERRTDWLSSTSRRIFGTLIEKNIIILVDLSVSNIKYLIHIQHSLRLLLEQQMANKDFFNIIGFGSGVKPWKPTVVKPTAENIQAAWKWILSLQCGGSRNFLQGFRAAVENEDEMQQHGIDSCGVYLFTSGVPDQPMDVTCSFVEEACTGRDIKLHTVLFNVDDYDDKGAIPGRYANITRTAECLRNMAHCSDGRFHWIRETGIIESDDVQLITYEIDKAINFSRKCALLVEMVKKKYPKYSPMSTECLLRALPPPPPSQPTRALPAPHRTPPTTPDSVKALQWRPSSANSDSSDKVLTRRPRSAKEPLHKAKPRPKEKRVITSSFFLEDKTAYGVEKTGTVYTKYPTTKSVKKQIVCPTIPNTEDVMTTKEWMRMYSLSRQKLNLNKLISGPDCKHEEKHVKSVRKHVSAKYCNIFPSVNINGTIKHLQLLPHELEQYEVQVEQVLKRYLKRLQWLLSGSRRVFGTIIHKQCVILIDTSGSMEPYMTELKKALTTLIWEQLHKLGAHFNLIQFSHECTKWQPSIQPANEDICHDAVEWVSELSAGGNTCTLEAIKLAFRDERLDGVYLLTDGKPDTSTSLVLREVAVLNERRNIPINTISFNCEDSVANSFLKELSTQTNARYHQCHGDFDADLFAHKLLTDSFKDGDQAPYLPAFEGDDLKRLGVEINLASKYITQAKTYRSMYPAPESGDAGFTVGRPATAVL